MSKNWFLKMLIGIIVLIILVYSIDINLIVAVKEIKRYYLLLLALFIPLCINPLISSNRWKILLKVQGIIESSWSLIKINFVSVFLGILLPSSAGFDAIRIYIIEKRNRQRMGNGGAAVVIERLLGIFILSLIGIIGSIYAVTHGASVNILYSIVIIHIFITLIALFFRNRFLFNKIKSLLERIKKFKRLKIFFSSIYTSINCFPLLKVLPSTVPLILLFQISNIICGALIFMAFNINVPFFFHLAFFPLISIISIIPISISGLGLREGAFVYFYGLLGVNSNISFLVSLIYYFLLMVIPACVGLLIFIFGSDQYKDIKNELNTQHDN